MRFKATHFTNIILKSKRKGVTLIETLVYLALLGFILTTLGGFATFIIKSNSAANDKIDIQKNIIFLNEHFSDIFKSSTAIVPANSIFNSNTGKIQLTATGKTYIYQIVSNKLSVNVNGTENQLINSAYRTDTFNIQQVYDSKNNLVGAKIQIILTSISNDTVQGSLDSMFLLKS